MNFEVGAIVVIQWHMLEHVIGRHAEVTSVHPCNDGRIPVLLQAVAPGETWYVLIDQIGERRAAAHSWLRRAKDPWTPSATTTKKEKPDAVCV